jgi:hypothetical protein
MSAARDEDGERIDAGECFITVPVTLGPHDW